MSAAVFGLGVHFVPMDLLYLWGRTVNKLNLSGMVAMALLLQGCAVTNTITDVGTAVFCGKSSMYCEMISQQTSEDVASGTAYDSAYTIQKTVTGKYVLRSKALKEPIVLARPLSLQKLQSFRTQQATFDIYAAPSEDCPQRYMAVVGTERKIAANAFGCEAPLKFLSASQRDSVFATESQSVDGQTPWAYRLTASGIKGPAAVTLFRDHPEYAFFRDQERGVAAAPSPSRQPTYRPEPSSRSASTPAPTARAPSSARTPSASPSAPPSPAAVPVAQRRRLPPPEKVTLPGEVEEKEAVYERPSVDL